MRMKWTLVSLIAVVVIVGITTMGNDEEVTRMEVDTGDEEYTISQGSLERYKGYWDEVEWGDHDLPNMDRTQDVIVTHVLNETGEELDYVIWFHDDGTATIVSPKAKEGIGEWNEEYGMLLEAELLE
ncbi:hypothetical protein [Alkalibacillus silvisoli]|uniref:DUF3139 domain-containing protein n=1 Tax=Alkalibacillus silvisoli TaxID=392823 RepID=A0ABN0ZQK3_9BACI